jgi:hypothetical protein
MRIRLIVLAFLFTAGLVLVFQAPELLANPGSLVKGHAEVEGDCFKCHTPLLGPSDAKCIACHKLAEIGAKKPEVARFHQRLAEKHCVGCHTDHIGKDVAKATREFAHALLEPNWRAVCHECHAKPADVLHKPVTTACASCHVAEKWVPATFDHVRYFRFDRDHPADCATCHVDGHYDRFTCYGCHEHSEAEVREEHLDEDIRDFEKCTECHRSGDEDEAERIWKSKRRGLPYRGGRGRDDDHKEREKDD